MSEVIYLTKQGYQEKEQELDYLIKVRRPQTVEAVKVAREFGDLSENAEYDAAKDEQGRVEDRIRELENLLSNVKILEDDATPTDAVAVGTKVTVFDEDMEEEEEFSIVSTVEADFFAGKISNESQLGAALLGHKVGDVVEVKAPMGVSRFRIVKIGR